ncbi:helix-turn-helix domain-containing protein [Companilactobacillus jidongensis]|uniref:helix-turn-helix domain-containing protein n=1 Tax=Companilactobacillus jidongensis TaxID=2486006 RepID=UPI001CDB6A13|nr:helix-turn-helix transcriptional regulator [Companilactobacillus jidongensis]
MIRNNLAVLLAERSLKITRVANDTGISRNTITSTAQNDGKMIQLETINKLCQYLDIRPDQFFEYLPFDIFGNFSLNNLDFSLDYLDGIMDANHVTNAVINSFDMDSFISISSSSKNGNNTITTLDCKVKPNLSTDNTIYGPDNSLELNLIPDDNNDNDIATFKNYWERTPAGFKTDLHDKFTDNIKSNIDDYIFNQMTDAWEGFEPLFLGYSNISLDIRL